VVNATPRATLREWLLREKTRGSRWVIIALDGFDGNHYPMGFDENNAVGCLEKIRHLEKEDRGMMQDTLVEVYDLKKDLDEQLNQIKANYPPTVEALVDPSGAIQVGDGLRA
jgi:hypothetical protein